MRLCRVKISGGTFTILDSGGIGDHVRWRVSTTDGAGNAILNTCETQIVRPGPGPA